MRVQQREQQEQLQLMRIAHQRPAAAEGNLMPGNMPTRMPGSMPGSAAEPELDDDADDTNARVGNMLHATRLASSRAKTLAALSGETRPAEMSPGELRAYAAELREKAAALSQSSTGESTSDQPKKGVDQEHRATAPNESPVPRQSGVQKFANSAPIRVAGAVAGGALAGGQRIVRVLSFRRQSKDDAATVPPRAAEAP